MTPCDSNDLRRELSDLPLSFRERLVRSGFDAERLLRLAAPLHEAARLGAEPAAERQRRLRSNRVRGPVNAPHPSEISRLPEEESERARLHAIGEDAISRGELALCVMAGGMATRMGGLVKALVPVYEHRTFLDLRLAENRAWSRRSGRSMPLWLMTSEATDKAIRDALAEVFAPASVKTFSQDVGLRLTPEGRLFRDEQGSPSVYATGHGDLVDALRRSSLLDGFLRDGGKYVWIANLDNLGATIDPMLLGLFIERSTDLMVEVVPKAPGDRGGIPVHADGRLQVLEEFRLPDGFDATTVPVFNTNTFLVRADRLANVMVNWHWFEVEKSVEGRPVVQFERLLQELTAAMSAMYVRVPRDGKSSRFLPVKDREELELRRSDIEAVARARGMV